MKSTALLLCLSATSIFAFAQTSTTKPTTTTTTTKNTTVKTPVNHGNGKTPQTVTKKPTPKKTPSKTTHTTTTTTTKTVTPAKVQPATPPQKTPTPTPATPAKTETPGKMQIQTFTPEIQKSQTAPIVIPKPNSQTPTPANPTPSTPPQAKPNLQGNGNTVTPSNNNTTGGKINMGGGTDNGSNTNTNTNGGKINNGTSPTPNNNNNSIINDITNGDATSAIKEALMKGVQVGVDKVSVTDGYLGNSLIKIPFPSQVSQVESALRNFGMGSLVDNAVTSMNRAAESAASQAGPIFLNSIKNMNVTDAVTLVTSKQPDAATQFLQRTTTESLVTAFKPSIKTALDKTLATKYWSDITTYYNKIPFVSPISTDLPDYVTRKAIDGLFVMVAQEEAKIRKDPGGQANQIINTVFSKVKF